MRRNQLRLNFKRMNTATDGRSEHRDAQSIDDDQRKSKTCGLPFSEFSKCENDTGTTRRKMPSTNRKASPAFVQIRSSGRTTLPGFRTFGVSVQIESPRLYVAGPFFQRNPKLVAQLFAVAPIGLVMFRSCGKPADAMRGSVSIAIQLLNSKVTQSVHDF